MRIRSLASVLLGVLSTVSAPAAAARDKIDALVADVMTRLHVPGVAVAVVRAGKVEKVAGYGFANLEWQAKVTSSTRFQIASVTKLLTGTLLLLLAQDGKLALTDPVSKYLPDAPPTWSTITIAHLAAHASGIAGTLDPAHASLTAAYAAVRDRPLTFPVGSRSSYMNGDFAVLGLILERVSGQTFPELLRKRLVEPLQLKCTSFDEASEVHEQTSVRTARLIPQRASVYRWSVDHHLVHWGLYPPWAYLMGGAFSCIDDLVTWAVAMDRGTLVSAESALRMATPFRLSDGTSAGFGVVFAMHDQRGHHGFGHSGGPALADVIRFPEDKLTIIVLANQQRMLPNLAGAIAGLLLPEAPDTVIHDPKADATRRARQVADGIRSGTPDPASFAPGKRGELVSHFREWGPRIAPWPAIERWSLVEGSPTRRVYRAHHGPIAARWKLTLDADGLITDLEVEPD